MNWADYGLGAASMAAVVAVALGVRHAVETRRSVADIKRLSQQPTPPRFDRDPYTRALMTTAVTPSRGTVLVADDEQHIVRIAMRTLEEAGYSSVGVFNGLQAWEDLQENPAPDVFVVDVMMPVMDGFQLREKLSEDARFAEIPFVFLTAKPSDLDTFEEWTSLFANDLFLTKPFHPAELVNTIRQAVEYGGKRRHHGE